MKSKQPVISDHRAGPRAHKVVTVALLVALLTGLIPPPLAHSILPPAAATLVETALPQPAVAQAAGTITGKVFQDFNANGQLDTTTTLANAGNGGNIGVAVDVGVGGVTVTAYDANGASCGTTTSSATAATLGQYSLAHTCTASTVRVEFTNLPAGYYPSTQGVNNGTSVQFVADNATNVDFAINYPADYSQANPDLAITNFQAGAQNTGGANLWLFPYNAKSALNNAGGPTPGLTSIALDSQIGTAYGLGYSRQTRALFAGAYLKRHYGFGPGGPGAIYAIRPGTDLRFGTGDDTVSLFATVPNAGSDPHTPADWFHDAAAFALVGKLSLGDIEIAEDGQTLYVINLNDRKLYQLPLIGSTPTAGAFSSVTLPDPGTGATGCPLDATTPAGELNRNLRPMALGIHHGKLYVGLTCTAESTANANDLRGFVYEYDGTTFTQVFNFPLNYMRNNSVTAPTYNESWRPWASTFPAITSTSGNGQYTAWPQPLLADIEFDGSNLLLGIRDIAGDQIGGGNGSTDTNSSDPYFIFAVGDVLRACGTVGAWTLETNGSCGGVTTAGTGNNDGPGGGEYYHGDDNNYPPIFYGNVAQGTLAQAPGFPDMVAGYLDPDYTASAGVRFVNHATGTLNKVVDGLRISAAGAGDGKDNALGDVELLLDPPPLEIGNRVWRDTDNDGIQDPNEPPLANVVVELYQGGVKVGQATTDANGEYYFGGANSRNMLTSSTIATTTVTVAASSDDAAQTVGSGAVNINNGALNLPYNGTALNLIGMRFANLTIPYSTTITSAMLRFTANGNASTTVNLTIRGEATDNAATFAATTNNLSSRATTSAAVNWTPGAWTNGATTNATTPDLKTIVQEVVNRAGWNSGNSLALLISDNSTPSSSNRRVARSFDNSSGGAAVLTVAYLAPYSLQANSAYEMRIPNASGSSQQAAFSGLSLTTQDANGVTSNDPVLDMRDSDGASSGINAVINYTTGSAGMNNHTLDFGFSTPATGAIRVVKTTLGGDGAFDFTSTDPDLDAVSITTVGNSGNSGTPFTKNAGTYTITEDALTGWSLNAITVTGESLSNSTTDVSNRQAVVKLEAGETITVTFVNSQTTTAPCAPHTVINNLRGTSTTSNGGTLGPLNDQATVQINPCVYDYGDLPDGSAGSPAGLPTTSPGYNTDITGTVGAKHQIVAGLYLGTLVDDETGGQPDSDALGDDNTGTPDDEDGVTFPIFTPGESATITVSVVNTIGNAAILYGFIDWNGDGSFDDASETMTQSVSSGVGSQVRTLSFNVPANADTTQRLGARFRLSTETGLGPDGAADDGEVEDYLISLQALVSLGNLVWRDTNNNGVYESGLGENGIDNVVVELRNLAGTLVATDTTSSGGYYLFPDLAPDAYRVTVAASNFATGQPLFGLVSSTDPVSAANINADVNDDDNGPGRANAAVTSAAITLTVGGEPTTDGDSDANSNLTVDFGFYAPRSELRLTKTLASAAVAQVGDRVIYDLRIENSGEITATELTLVDQYDPAALQYATATVTPDLQSSGLITWTGSTAAGSFQPYLPLAPGGVFTVTVEFTAKRP